MRRGLGKRLVLYSDLWPGIARRRERHERLLPDFLIVGAQKCGTSTLAAHLSQHPRLLPPSTKEVHFFDQTYGRGLDWYKAHFRRVDAADRLSRRTGASCLTFEATPYYIFHPAIAERIAQCLPKAKIIIMLRDPVDRAYSHYQHEKSRGYEPLSFEEALENEPHRLQGEEERLREDESYVSRSYMRYSYIARGLYAEQLARALVQALRPEPIHLRK